MIYNTFDLTTVLSCIIGVRIPTQGSEQMKKGAFFKSLCFFPASRFISSCALDTAIFSCWRVLTVSDLIRDVYKRQP